MIFLFLAELLRKIDIYSLHFKPNLSFLFMFMYGVTDGKLALEFIANFYILWFWDYMWDERKQIWSHMRKISNLFTYLLDTLHTYTYKLYLFTLASTTLQADFHEGRDLELFTG
jgi:hypothetical protein